GVAQIVVDSGTGAGFQTYTGTFTYAGQGQRVINFYAVDKTGNTSPTSLFRVFIDTAGPPVSSSPTIPPVLLGTTPYARLATGFAITTGVDNLSGLKTVTVLADGVPANSPVQFFSEGPHTLEAFATDNVGNQTSPHIFTSLVTDETPPVSMLVVNGVPVSSPT